MSSYKDKRPPRLTRAIVPISYLREPIFERQESETVKAYRAWEIYRGLDPLERSMKKTSEIIPTAVSVVNEWGRKYRWQERIKAWDTMVELRRLHAQVKAIEEMDDRHARVGMTMLSKVAQRLVGDDANNIQAIDLNRLSAQDLARLAEVATKIERLGRGAETDRSDNTNRPVEVRLAFDSQPRYPADLDGVAKPAGPAVPELPPGE